MGNSVLDGRKSTLECYAAVTNFYTPSAWIQTRSEDQITQLSRLEGVQKIAAFPDLHPGKYGPVGCAVLADRIFPQLVGNDIGCGMSLFQLDLVKRKFKLDKSARRLRVIGTAPKADQRARLEAARLSPDLFGPSLGTIGGGNHFCELQTLAQSDPDQGLDKTRLYLLIHSGSRGLGSAVFGVLPAGTFCGLEPDSEAAQNYLRAHDDAVKWASLNRKIIAERAATALRCDLELITDVAHNLVTRDSAGWLHRKGAARSDQGLIPLAGSRATPSYLMQALPGADDALKSCAHGAGRRYDRSSMHGRVQGKKSDIIKMQTTPFGGRVICEDRALLVEEAPQAYKSAQSVVADLVATKLAKPVARFNPLLTFKKTRAQGRT